MIRTFALSLLLTLPLVACGGNPELHIESNTEWEAYVESNTNRGLAGRTVHGSGHEVVDMGPLGSCWRVTKRTEHGHLRAYSRMRTLTGVIRDGDASTDAPFGVVTGCN